MRVRGLLQSRHHLKYTAMLSVLIYIFATCEQCGVASIPRFASGMIHICTQFGLLLGLFVKPMLVRVEGTQSGGAVYQRVVLRNVICTAGIVTSYSTTTLVVVLALLRESLENNKVRLTGYNFLGGSLSSSHTILLHVDACLEAPYFGRTPMTFFVDRVWHGSPRVLNVCHEAFERDTLRHHTDAFRLYGGIILVVRRSVLQQETKHEESATICHTRGCFGHPVRCVLTWHS